MSEPADRFPEPAHRLPPAARSLWRTQIAGFTILVAALSGGMSDLVSDLGLPGWALPVAALVVGFAAAAVVPALRWRNWRYEVRADEIDLRHGTFTVKRTLVPIRRVQHVDTATGPLDGMFGLATVAFHTAAGKTEVPALTRGEAESIRHRVGELTRTRDDV